MRYLQAFVNPEASRHLNKGSNKNQLALVMMRQWWHGFYDHCPTLLQSFNDNGKDFLETALIDLSERKQLNVGYHLCLIEYLRKTQPYLLSSEIISELLVSFCTQWIRTNKSSSKTVVVYSKNLNIFYVGQKSLTLGSNPSIEFYENTEFSDLRDLVTTELLDAFEDVDDYNEVVAKMISFHEFF